MPALAFGSAPVADLKVGTTQVSRAYLGTTLVWSSAGAQVWTASAATVTVTGGSGTWSRPDAPQTWTASPATVTVTGTSGTWSRPDTGFKTTLGTQVASTSGTTLVITTTAAIAVGDLVVVRASSDNLNATTPTFTCADSGGNTYTTQVQGARNVTAAAGIAGAIMMTYATVAVGIGGTITVTLSGAVAARAASAESFTGYLNAVRSTGVAASGTGTTATVASGTVSSGDLVIGALALESRTAVAGDADTLNGAWSTVTNLPNVASGTDATRVQISGQYKIATSSGAQTFNHTVTSTDWLELIVVMQSVAGATAQTFTRSPATVTATATSGVWSTGAAPGEITFVSASTTTYGSRTNTTVTAPASIADNDLILLGVLTGAGTEAPDPTPPAGFTLTAGPSDATDFGAFNLEVRIYHKVAASEGASYVFTHTTAASQGFALAYRGVNTTTPLDTTPTVASRSAGGPGVGNIAIATGLTTVTNGAMVVFIAQDWGATTNNLTPPTGTTPTFTERFDVAPLIYAADGLMTAAGATGNKSFPNNSSSSDAWGAFLIALRPA